MTIIWIFNIFIYVAVVSGRKTRNLESNGIPLAGEEYNLESLMPRFAERILNVTVTVGRDALLACVVDNLRGFKSGMILASMVLAGNAAPQIYQTTPVPILKQINRHNDDGSYSYGFEAADGTFKIETKYATGEVFGKYGYVGDDGKIRVVEYGASERGFEPKGSDINVAPPTLSNSINDISADYDDGEYREDPSIYEKEFASRPSTLAGSTVGSTRPRRIQVPQARFPVRQRLDVQSRQFRAQTQSQAHSQAHPQPLVQARAYPAFQPRPGNGRITYDPSIFNGHPATNIDINTGSFTVSYTS